MRSLKSVRRRKPENQTPNESLRELRYNVGKFGARETARRMGVPESTLRRWAKQGRIPGGESLERARGGIERLRDSGRKKREPQGGDKDRRGPGLGGGPIVANQDEQREAAFWLLAAGVKLPNGLEAARKIVSGGEVGAMDAVSLDEVRSRVLAIFQSGDTMDAGIRGYEIARGLKSALTQEGQNALNEAALRGAEWLLTAIGVPPGGVVAEKPDGSTRRNIGGDHSIGGSVFTNDSFNVWDIVNYARNLPAGLFYLTYTLVEKEGYPFGVYQVDIYVLVKSDPASSPL